LDGRSLLESGLTIDSEIQETYEQLKAQISNVPQGTMMEIVDDTSWGQWDELIDATERAHGPMFGDKTMKELYEERRAEIARKGSEQ
jgi:hypothetical protein